jgi:microcystin-dependent protein
MPLETATFIPDLVTSNPAHTDGLNAADAHLRLIKSAVKATLPNFTSSALASTQAQLDAAVAATTGTAVSQFPLGSAALPGITPVGDPNTGIYSPGADQLSFAVGGAQALSIGADKSVACAGALGTVGGIACAGTMGASAYTGGTGQLVPTGTPLMWLTDTAPTGFLMANGQLVSRTTFAALFALFGAVFGAGDGSTTFGMPDMRDVAPIGKSTMGGTSARGLISHLTTTTVGAVVGEEQHTLSAAEMPSHTHAALVVDPGHTHGVPTYGPSGSNGNFITGSAFNGSPNTETSNAATTGITLQDGLGHTNVTQPAGSGTAHNNVQPSMVVNYIIKT